MPYSNNFQHKIRTVKELRQIIGPRPREHSVIMCHGTFDLVHPGHIRHLVYAASKAKILVVGVTADIHNHKTIYRPFIPQDLRALNLAALEMVDYVIIDAEARPLKLLAELQPDIFAKGYEYRDLAHQGTQQEVALVESYGGEVIFSPGDVVYSSSAIIEHRPPDLSLEKLRTLMEAQGVSFQNLLECIRGFNDIYVHVLGDTIVDSITHTSLIGGGSKTPTLSVRWNDKQDYVGGAAIVAKHLHAAGTNVTFSTMLCPDGPGRMLIRKLPTDRFSFRPITDKRRPTTHKNVIICDGHPLLKIDTVDNASISDAELGQFCSYLAAETKDIVIFSDFRHGIFNSRTIPKLWDAVPKTGTFTVADSQVASRWGNILDFYGFDLITPNEREARFALGDQDSGIRPLATELFNMSGCCTLMLKLGQRGVLTCVNGSAEPGSFFIIDSLTRAVVDPVGAGDAFLAYASLGLRASRNELIGTILGSVAAALECEVEGNQPITKEAVLERLQTLEKLTH